MIFQLEDHFRGKFILILLTSFVVSCVSPNIQIIQDTEANRRTYRLSDLSANANRGTIMKFGLLELSIDMYVPLDSYDTSFSLKVSIVSQKQWTIIAGDTLNLELDDHELNILCTESLFDIFAENFHMHHTSLHMSGGVYNVDRMILHQIASARSVKINVHAMEGIVAGNLEVSAIVKIDKFRKEFFP